MHILTALALAATLAVPAPAPAVPSSHREAPGITEMPKVDGTDFYMFRSYEPGQDGFVTLIADYQPLQAPYGGPNYFFMDPEALYEIHVDNDGDARADLTFRFRFRNTLKDLALTIGPPGNQQVVSVPLLDIAPLSAASAPGLNLLESYSLEVVMGDHAGTPQPVKHALTGATVFAKPLDNVGNKSIPDYASYAAAHVHPILLPGGAVGRVFVGQRKDPFVVNLGEVFDLVNLNPLGSESGESDALADANVTALVLELPISFLTGGNPVIGGWTTASLPATSVLATSPTFEKPALAHGPYRQVSRLGMPLVNEVVIGVKDKNLFNASEPADDAQFLTYVTHPTLPALIEVLFGVQAPKLFPRSDLVSVFLTGVPGLNANGSTAEMLRLNTAIPPTAKAQQQRMGVLAGDLAGFPNGRRPGDDVVDAALRVVMGALISDAQLAPDGAKPYTDGAFLDSSFFDDAFPYLRTPLPGAPQP
jgi:hypothetical protein